jgi:DNA polymerase-3 subunit gamma/tau
MLRAQPQTETATLNRAESSRPKVEVEPVTEVRKKPAAQDTSHHQASADTPSNQNNAGRQFDGNWRGLIERLKLGIVTSLAQNCELVSHDEHSISLSVPESKKHLLMPQYQEKLTSVISEHFGKKTKLQFSIGGSGNTPAKQITVEKAQKQATAEQSIEQDVFVQALINEFDASIVHNSIKPI